MDWASMTPDQLLKCVGSLTREQASEIGSRILERVDYLLLDGTAFGVSERIRGLGILGLALNEKTTNKKRARIIYHLIVFAEAAEIGAARKWSFDNLGPGYKNSPADHGPGCYAKDAADAAYAWMIRRVVKEPKKADTTASAVPCADLMND